MGGASACVEAGGHGSSPQSTDSRGVVGAEVEEEDEVAGAGGRGVAGSKERGGATPAVKAATSMASVR